MTTGNVAEIPEWCSKEDGDDDTIIQPFRMRQRREEAWAEILIFLRILRGGSLPRSGSKDSRSPVPRAMVGIHFPIFRLICGNGRPLVIRRYVHYEFPTKFSKQQIYSYHLQVLVLLKA